MVIREVKGKTRSDTIFFPYHYNFFEMIPNYSRNDTLLLFVNKLKRKGYFGRLDLVNEIKSSEIVTYIDYIERYSLILEQPVDEREQLIFNWRISLACIPLLSWESAKGLRDYNISDFDLDSKNDLRQTLISINIYDFRYRDLLLLVSSFGKNAEVIDYCIDQLELILDNKNKMDYSIGFMRAVSDMTNQKKYYRLIKEFQQSQDDRIKQVEIVQRFITMAS